MTATARLVSRMARECSGGLYAIEVADQPTLIWRSAMAANQVSFWHSLV